MRDPAILCGEPVVQGTRVSVRAVVRALRFDGSLDAVAPHFPHVERSVLVEALAYHEVYRAEIDECIRATHDDAD